LFSQKSLAVVLPTEPGFVTISLRHGFLLGKRWKHGQGRCASTGVSIFRLPGEYLLQPIFAELD